AGALPSPYAGPPEIPADHQPRSIDLAAGYVALDEDEADADLDALVAQSSAIIQQEQQRLLRLATPGQLASWAEQAAQTLQTLAHGSMHLSQRADLEQQAFYLLVMLSHAHEMTPQAGWSEEAIGQRHRLATASGQLLNSVGGTGEAKATLT